ncbi:MAG TPA: hypothetical protein ENJ00_11000, partial [Phycisphaerales bacterium]|nr:hypothetical protein [Phycisphaerales bacterium]
MRYGGGIREVVENGSAIQRVGSKFGQSPRHRDAADVVSYEYSNSFLAAPRNWSGQGGQDPNLIGP